LIQDLTLSEADKVSLANMLQTLPPDKLRLLTALLRTVAGAGAGALIAKFLNQSGLIGSLLGGASAYFLS
jgi:hypothetical protein